MTQHHMPPTLLQQQMAASKGGVIGTAGRGVIALRFDDQPHLFFKHVMPLLQEFGLPASMAVLSITDQWYAEDGISWSDLTAWSRHGIEVWCHSHNHTDPSPDGYAGYYRELVQSRQTIEAQDMKVQGFILPGCAPLTNAVPYNGLGALEDYNSPVGDLLLTHYALSDASAVGLLRPLPFDVKHGLRHYTYSEDVPMSLTHEMIDRVVKYGLGIEMMCHPNRINSEGGITSAELREVITRIAHLWYEGKIEVLTPSGLCYADASTDRRLDLIYDGDLTQQPKTAGCYKVLDEAYWAFNGGSRNQNGITLNAGDSMRQDCEYLQTRCLGGEAFLLLADVQPLTPECQLALGAQDFTPARLDISRSYTITTPTTLRMPFGLAPKTNNLHLTLACQQGQCLITRVRALKV